MVDESPPPPVSAPVPHQNYGDATYWDQRYTREPVCFDWYQGYAGLEGVIAKHMRPEEPLLHVGMGSSKLQEGMVRQRGFKRVVNVDVSSVAVEMMAQLHKGVRELEYIVGDIRSLPQYPDSSFGAVLDKGTLDAILCGESPAQNAEAALIECCRLLRPGGCFMLVTYGDPESRLTHLLRPHLPWRVQVYALSKPSMEAVAAAAAAGGGDLGQRTAAQGPFDAESKVCMEAVGGLRDVHYVYVCTKQEAGEGGSGAAAAAAGREAPSDE